MNGIWESAKENPLFKRAIQTVKNKGMNLAKTAVCKADASTVKKAVAAMPDEMLATMIHSSPLCSKTGGKRSGHKRKTRKHSRKQRKTRKH